MTRARSVTEKEGLSRDGWVVLRQALRRVAFKFGAQAGRLGVKGVAHAVAPEPTAYGTTTGTQARKDTKRGPEHVKCDVTAVKRRPESGYIRAATVDVCVCTSEQPLREGD